MATLATESTRTTIVPSLAVSEPDTSLLHIALQDATSEVSETSNNVPEKKSNASQPMRVYTRPQLLFLSKSPLVKPPANMPELKDWFGENEQNLAKKESEPVTPGSARERRFRRDTEDGETTSRSTFRSTVSQPSQMGNFKHQSLRASDRDRDKDGEKDRERDIRDKEGQDRLRHLSDKYDRDRLALPLTGLRSKERDSAPHLAPGSTSRMTGQGQAISTGSRRAEPRELSKKKAGEASEDWRRGADPRPARDDRSERPVRDSSKCQREPSTSRRDHRDDIRRERDRDPDRENDEDPRRWRDDGKRDERMAARRGERHPEQYKERERTRGKESTWDATSERRWVPVEERDGRSKRTSGREKKITLGADEGKERDDRRDRDRDREKEPAWMDTYVPSSSSTGILGGKTGEGELDGIQAWKKEQKEKELKEQVIPHITESEKVEHRKTPEKSNADAKQLDEIQLFKLLMKREEEKKKNDPPPDSSHTNSPVGSCQSPTHHAAPPTTDTIGPPFAHVNALSPLVQPETVAPHSLLSVLGSKEPSILVKSSPAFNPVEDGLKPAPPCDSTLRENPPLISQNAERPAIDSVPPQGSRLLAFARTPSTAARPQVLHVNQGTIQDGHMQKQGASPDPSQRMLSSSGSLHTIPGFAPFEDQQRSSVSFEGQRDTGFSDTNRQGRSERTSLTPTIDHGSLQDGTSSIDNASGLPVGKGSRFAKFFDGKTRENGLPVVKHHAVGNVHSSPAPGGQRQELSSFGDSLTGSPDPRALDEIYLMLNSSAHGTRATTVQVPASTVPHHGSFNLQGQNNLHLLHQQLQQHHHQQLHSNRLEPLYESRLDDRNFVPDGMVPGLRSAPPRNRENSAIYPEALEDGMHYNPQRIPGQRGHEQVYSGVPPSLYSQPVARNGNMSLQQSQYRGGPSPLSLQQNLLPSQQQRLPPGLANLGGRPPHEPSQFLGMPGVPLHTGLHVNGSQQAFNTFPPGSGPSFGGGLQLRAAHQLQHSSGHHSGGHLNNMDPRNTNQNHFLGAAGVAGLRGAGTSFSVQQGPSNHIPNPLVAMRQQPQQQLPPHMVPHLLPHIQQHGVAGPNSQPAQDLMALLMGGSHRE